MSEFAAVMALAALPAVGNFVGGAAAELRQVSPRTLSLALHLAAGIVLGVVGLELMPEALAVDLPWVPLLAFTAGGVAFVGLDGAIGHIRGRLTRGGPDQARAMTIFAGVAIDLLSDGVMIGTGALIDPSLGLLLAIGQVPADVPEGFAAIATMRRAGVPRRTRLLMAAGLTIPVLGGAAIGYLLLRDAPALMTLSVLALTGGALLSVVVEEMVTEAHEDETSWMGPVFLTAGFSIFAAISTYVS